MYKLICLNILLIIFTVSVKNSSAQNYQSDNDIISSFFKETEEATELSKDLWNIDLYGPILLVDPDTRQIFSNYPDTGIALTQSGEIFTGILPDEINIANTALDWNGKRWAMIMLPLPEDKYDRLNLLSHELFHVSQPALGFKLFNPENNHLDQMQGRIFLKLELQALKDALISSDDKEIMTHLTNALTFRNYRNSIYPGSDSSENFLELNEGLAEYTGVFTSGRNKSETVNHFINSINNFYSNPTYVRSFAYQTIPVYGYLLYLNKLNKDDNIFWNREITTETNLTDYFIDAFEIKIPYDLESAVEIIKGQYDGQLITEEERIRDENSKKLIAEYKNKFITTPHLILNFEQMNVSFDPRNIVPLEDFGTVYPNIRVTDNWGILTVEKGALMSPNWDKITVSAPFKSSGNIISGDGWKLEMTAGYKIEKDEKSGDYFLKKE